MSVKKEKSRRGRPKKELKIRSETTGQTRLGALLLSRGMSHRDLIDGIRKKFGKSIGKDRISRIANGSLRDYYISTAMMIAGTLEVKIEEIIEDLEEIEA